MKSLSDLLKRFQRSYTDVLGLDVAGSGLKAVRLRRAEGTVSVVAADILRDTTVSGPLDLPKPLKARYVAMATSEPGAVVKLLNLPAHSDKPVDVHVHELMGLAENDAYRLSYEEISASRSDLKVLAVGLPGAVIQSLCGHFPSGLPAPCSVEVSGLAVMTAFERGPVQDHRDDCVVAIDFGDRTTLVTFYQKGVIVMIRKFDVGVGAIIKKLQDSLGVDGEVAMGILSDGSFDISQIVRQTMEPFLQQLIISWDFVERRENTRIARLYASGGGASIIPWMREVQTSTGQEPVPWNPFAGLNMASEGLLDAWKGQESRFAAAVGAAMGAMEEK